MQMISFAARGDDRGDGVSCLLECVTDDWSRAGTLTRASDARPASARERAAGRARDVRDVGGGGGGGRGRKGKEIDQS